MLDSVVDLFVLVTPRYMVAALAVASALVLVLDDRRLSLLCLLVQYILLGILVSPHIYRPLVFIRIGLGAVVCLMLYITATRVQSSLDPEGHPEGHDGDGETGAGQSLAFRLLVVALGGFIAYGLWQAYSLNSVPTELALTTYWLVTIGILMLLINREPLRQGMGLLVALSGFEALYMLWQESFVVISILGMFNLLVALAIAFCAEAWLESVEGEAFNA